MSGAEAAGEPRKRWDQFGRYRLDMQCEAIQRPRDIEPVPVSFGGTGRRLCLPSAGLTASIINGRGLIALALNNEIGLFSSLDSEAARSLANNLLRLADHLDGAQWPPASPRAAAPP